MDSFLILKKHAQDLVLHLGVAGSVGQRLRHLVISMVFSLFRCVCSLFDRASDLILLVNFLILVFLLCNAFVHPFRLLLLIILTIYVLLLIVSYINFV